MTKPITSVLLDVDVFTVAMLSAEAKDSTRNYKKLQNDRSYTLVYNPDTEDGIFVPKMNARMYLADGYYEAFPQSGRSRTLAANIAAINANGWPVIEGI